MSGSSTGLLLDARRPLFGEYADRIVNGAAGTSLGDGSLTVVVVVVAIAGLLLLFWPPSTVDAEDERDELKDKFEEDAIIMVRI